MLYLVWTFSALLVCTNFCSGTMTLKHQSDVLAGNKFHMNEECSAYFQGGSRFKLWVNAFINARYEISLVESDIKWNSLVSTQMTKRLNKFFVSNVSSCVNVIKKKPVWYVTIFKAANNNIRGNLQVCVRHKYPS